MKKKNKIKKETEVELITSKEHKKKIIDTEKIHIWQSWSGLIILILFLIVSYLSWIKPNTFVWLFFCVVSLPIIRRNYSDISAMLLGILIIVAALSGILFNGLNEFIVNEYLFTKPMCMGISIIGLIYVSFVSFYKDVKFITNMNIWLFYFFIILLSYPMFICIVSIGSLFGYLSVTILKILMYCLFSIPFILAIYLYYSRKKKVIE
jgi:magnesium-transporting ATPase (P-type)